MNLKKTVGQVIFAEQACLGACLVNESAFFATAETLLPDDFFKTEHRIIYETMLKMLKETIGVDTITVAEYLGVEKLEKIGGTTYLTHLINTVPTVNNIKEYDTIIQDASLKRAKYSLLTAVDDGTISIDDALDKLEILGERQIKDETFRAILENTMFNTLKGTEYKFSIPILNKHLGGLDKGELLTIGGYTSQAKSGLAIQLAIDFAIQKKNVLFLSTEMLSPEVGRRILGNLGSVNIMDIRKGMISPNETESLEFIAREIGEKWNMNIKKIFEIEDVSMNVRKYKPDILFLDYIQNLSGEDYNTATRNIKILQSITIQHELGTICVSQLNRNKDEIREPKLSDLRDTGRIEECSNMVLFIYWKERLQQKNKQRFGGEPPEEIEILVSKNRDGSIGRAPVHFYPEYARIEDMLGREYQQEMDYHNKEDR